MRGFAPSVLDWMGRFTHWSRQKALSRSILSAGVYGFLSSLSAYANPFLLYRLDYHKLLRHKMYIDRNALIYFRSLLIQLLNTVDDMLGLPRTIPGKKDRRTVQEREGVTR
jgi:hypothetical protein